MFTLRVALVAPVASASARLPEMQLTILGQAPRKEVAESVEGKEALIIVPPSRMFPE